jgi:uncharacterized protein (DUF885 family)
MKFLRTYLTLILGLLLITPASLPAEAPNPEWQQNWEAFRENPGDTPAQERLRQLFDLIWEYQMLEHPEWATYVGYPGQDDRWTDASLEAIERRDERTAEFLETLESLDREALDARAKLDYDLIRESLREDVEAAQFPGELLAITQLGGVHSSVPRLLEVMPGRKASDYGNILQRLRGVPKVVQQNLALLKKGLERGITQPKITLRDVPEQVRKVITEDVEESPLYRPFVDMPESIPAEERERLRQEARRVLTERVYPAFQNFHDYLSDTYIPGAREATAWTDLPQGEEWYDFKVRSYTTTDMTPREIHELGLKEVSRIREEMEQVMKETGFEGSFPEFLEFLRTDPQFFYETPEELLQGYRDICKKADPRLIEFFGKLPRLPYGVKEIPEHSAESAPTAYFQSGSMEAGRAGYFFANTSKLETRPKWEMEALALHEAVPGHHLQLALAQEMPEAHDLRKYLHYTSYIEGWGLYAEHLGEEMGFYEDPYSKFGQLSYEMWRAIRLVVDTGLHAFDWDRQRAIDYFLENSGKSEHDVTVEIDRYLVWPGQALSYKIGELKIKELRQRATEALGEDFDLRAFHDELLAHGAVPLNTLERLIEDWIEERKQ